jgi:glycosyltransferase involved in cell wall biosynthesis
MRVLYVTHYSIMEPLGQSQILPYLTALAQRGHKIEVISYEKSHLLLDSGRRGAQTESLRRCGIEWFPREYRRGDSLHSLLSDVFRASGDIVNQCKKNKIELLHCRVHVPFLMAWYASALKRIPLLFDFRGFLAEEYADAGLWKPRGIRFRVTKLLECRMVSWCSAMVVLTSPIRDYIKDAYRVPTEKLFVIPCCVDLERFFQKESLAPRHPGRPLRVIYSGSTGGRYKLHEMLRFFSLVLEKRPGSHFTILSTGNLVEAERVIAKSGVRPDAVSLQSVPHQGVPELLSKHDLGLIFLRGGLGLLASSPTKIGEYLACGLTIVAERGVGGLKEILEDQHVGCLVDSDSPESWPAALDEALRLCDQPDIRQKSMATASKYYSLEEGVDTYARAYEYAVRHPRHGFGRSRAL